MSDINNKIDEIIDLLSQYRDEGTDKFITPKEAKKRLTALIQSEVRAGRIDENDIWLAHSTSRRLNDNEPAIRTIDFKERISELKKGI